MHSRLYLAVNIVGGILMIIQLTGCTILGTMAGAASTTKPKTISGWELVEVKSGQRVRLHMENDSTIETKYRGVYTRLGSQYAAAYANWVQERPDRQAYPDFGSEIVVTPVAGAAVIGLFDGLDVDRVNVRAGAKSTAVRFSDILSLSGQSSAPLTGARLAADVTAEGAPLRRHFWFDDGAGTHDVDPRDIREVFVYGHNHAGTGLAVGLAIDAIVVAVLALAIDDEPSGGGGSYSGTSGSCPYVYSFDGSEYTLDAEPFGGAWFQAGQRTDFVRLDHMRAFDGVYRMRIATELDETDHIDAAKLIAVDHPAGTEVVPTFEGRMLVLSDPVRPFKARAFDGSDALDRLTEDDGNRWTSNPFGRNLNDPAGLRDGLTVAFPRPAGSDSATVAVTVQNTPWTQQLASNYLRLHGEELESWYQTMNNSAGARRAFTGTLVREVLLAVEVWNGQSWRRAGTVWGIGPAVDADRALRIDLADVPGDTLQIRLSSTAGLWMVDRVVVDYGPPHPSGQIALRTLAAIDESGSDVVAEVSETDAVYHTMPEKGHRVDMTFDAPDLQPGLERTLVLAATGYYKVHLDAEGPGDQQLARMIATEPNVFAHWALGGLYRELDNAIAAAGF